MDYLFENQPRWAERLAGIAALMAGIFALGFAAWLYWRDVMSGRNIAARPVALFTIPVGLYALVLARRLLASPQHRPAHLVSPPILVVMGMILVVGGLLPLGFSSRNWPEAISGLVLGIACVTLAVRRWRKSDGDAA
jgi:uncharacterized membrane protein YoaK (UPF0700 family)